MNNSATTTDHTWLETVRECVRSLQFGSVEITVHHGAVVQIERIEKIRVEAAKAERRP